MNMFDVKSFREDGKSGENDEGREELHGCVFSIARRAGVEKVWIMRRKQE